MINGKTAVVLMNLGGPDSLDAVEPFLYNLFCDPDIINFPLSFLFRKLLAKIISSKRAPVVKEYYSKIGGKSPINELTKLQADLLEEKLKKSLDIKVFVAMRYWKPFTENVLKEINSEMFDQIILLPLYPQYSVSTTGSSFNEWKKKLSIHKDLKITKTNFINNYHTHPLYIKSIIQRIRETLLKFESNNREKVLYLFSAHGTPMKLVKQGDLYSKHITETVNAVVNEMNLKNYKLCYQSKVGPQKWLTPSTPDTIKESIKNGEEYILVIPIAFVSDHLETLFELGIEYRHLAESEGVKQYEVMEGLNGSEFFISALEDLVLKEINKQ